MKVKREKTSKEDISLEFWERMYNALLGYAAKITMAKLVLDNSVIRITTTKVLVIGLILMKISGRISLPWLLIVSPLAISAVLSLGYYWLVGATIAVSKDKKRAEEAAGMEDIAS